MENALCLIRERRIVWSIKYRLEGLQEVMVGGVTHMGWFTMWLNKCTSTMHYCTHRVIHLRWQCWNGNEIIAMLSLWMYTINTEGVHVKGCRSTLFSIPDEGECILGELQYDNLHCWWGSNDRPDWAWIPHNSHGNSPVLLKTNCTVEPAQIKRHLFQTS